MLKEMRNDDGTPRVCENVRISSIGCSKEEKVGKLTAGYGAGKGGPKIGPEFTFGIYLQKMLDEPILLIKTAWGGKDISGDFRPPSAGAIFPDHSKVKPRKTNRGMMPAEQVIARAEKKQHVYYNAMVKHVNSVLADPGKYSPHYNRDVGYEIAGFVWFQGFNDMIDGGTYNLGPAHTKCVVR